MSRKKKNRNQNRVEELILITAILNLVDKLIDLAIKLVDCLTN